MPYGTLGQGCGVVEREGSPEFVVASGYRVVLEELQTVQIYSLEDDAWRIGTFAQSRGCKERAKVVPNWEVQKALYWPNPHARK